MSKKKKVVLAFSGGLDTTYCAKFLSSQGMDVYSCTVNTGGFSEDELDKIAKRAQELGVKEHKTIEATESFYHGCVKYLIFGNVLKNETYPLSVSAERAFQAYSIAKYARAINADIIAHGSTGAGNDQVRFDLAFHIICPKVQVLTPIRDQNLSRDEEIAFLQAEGVKVDCDLAKYSINKGLWGASVGGVETLTSHGPLPEKAYPNLMTKDLVDHEVIKIGFVKGEPVSINGKTYSSPVALIAQLEVIATPYGVGRDIHVGDTIINTKGRVGFEAAAPMLLIKAHHALEKHVLTSKQMKAKQYNATLYGELIHEGQFLEPAARNLEAFLLSTQNKVSGEVTVNLAPYRFTITGISSKNDLMATKFGSYGERTIGWSGEQVKGFTKILSLQSQIYHEVHDYEDL